MMRLRYRIQRPDDPDWLYAIWTTNPSTGLLARDWRTAFGTKEEADHQRTEEQAEAIAALDPAMATLVRARVCRELTLAGSEA